jgi:hypothetical protein
VTEAGFYIFFNAKNELIEVGKYHVLWKKLPVVEKRSGTPLFQILRRIKPAVH